MTKLFISYKKCQTLKYIFGLVSDILILILNGVSFIKLTLNQTVLITFCHTWLIQSARLGESTKKSDKLSSGRADFKKLKNSKNVQIELFSLLAMKRQQWSASNTDEKERKRERESAEKRGKSELKANNNWRLFGVHTNTHTHTKTHSTTN